MVGITEGDTVRIKVLREDIEDLAPLFVTSTDTAVVTVVAPPGGGPLPADNIFSITGVKDLANRPVAVQVRIGDANGPIIGEIEPHVFQQRTLRVRAHLVTINGTATARTAASLVNTFADVNRIWRPCGIQFTYNQADTMTEVINGFSVAGQMTTSMNTTTAGHTNTANDWAEFSSIINTRPVNSHINVYFTQAANEVFGLTFNNKVARPNGYGIVSADPATSNSVAHELCHYLDNPNHAQQALAPGAAHQDIWARRRLMWTPSPWNPSAIAHQNNVGYGANTRGALMTVKEHPATVDVTDNELARARRRALNPY
jgi:hypothetical protein